MSINDLVGRPYETSDCFLLAQDALACFGITLEDDPRSENWGKVSSPAPGDVVLFNKAGDIIHIGVMVNDSQFIHASAGRGAVIESLSLPRYRNRLEGIYRYQR